MESEVLLHAIWFIAVSLTCDGKIEEIEDSTIPHSFNSVEFLISTNLTLIPPLQSYIKLSSTVYDEIEHVL